jgi:hypothetical protein
MAVTAKKLGQMALSTSATTLVTGVTGGTTEVSSMWLVNTGTVARTVKIYAYGTGTSNENLIMQWTLDPNGGSAFFQLNNTPIILATGETLRLVQDAGNDVTCTVFGIEETP